METETPDQTETEPETEAPPSTNGDGPVPESSPAEQQSATEMFRYSEFVHIGPGAVECAEGEDGSCANPLHFHAWCRLPNQFQAASIREKALAAKARKIRQLRDPNTDAYEVLEGELADMTRAADKQGTEILIDDLLAQDFWQDHLTAVREIQAEDDFSSITEDQDRLQHLSSLPEEDRPGDEFQELERHLANYNETVDERREKEQQPKREAMSSQSAEELIGMVREARIEAEANEDFMRTYSLWEWYIGTMKPRPVAKGLPNERVFGDVQHLQQAAPEVISELERVFGELEAAMGSRGAVGN